MSVTIVVCREKNCGRMLNGEIAATKHGKFYCNEHIEKKTSHLPVHPVHYGEVKEE